ncbi:MAG: glycoside hydrolase family 13 protein [Christensenellales bacterium]|jgi:glycosidase
MRVIFGDEVFHNSRRDKYRHPQGALETGQKCLITLDVKSSVGEVEVYLHFAGKELRMTGTGGEIRSFSAEISRDEPGAYFYCFKIVKSGDEWWYGKNGASGIGAASHYMPGMWQVTVYDNFKTPDWFKHSAIYQIFPDRFARGDEDKAQSGFEYHKKAGRKCVKKQWGDMPEYLPFDGEEHYRPADFFLGDLHGIIKKLDYIKSMGISCIYLNPIFEADSNHRYNTGDYMKIDPILGDLNDFEELCREAESRSIRIILDGVFSHTGSDSVYFNRYGRYGSNGAYQSRDSEYFEWYDFFEYPDKYRSWWGFDSLPEVNEYNGKWQDFIISGQDSVIKHWLYKGAAGWRLDVADELPDDIIKLMRGAVKRANPEAVLIGEVWEDATNKQAYGKTREYAMGQGLDSVMNYPLRSLIIDFLMNNMNVVQFCHGVNSLAENYPPEMFFALMNIMGGHDVVRVRTVLGGAPDRDSLSRPEQAAFELTPKQRELAMKRQRLAALLQFVMPGAPCVYYGDEAGMEGMADPFNRGCFPWQDIDEDMLKWHRLLGQERAAHENLRTGGFIITPGCKDVVAIIRHIRGGKDVFGVEQPDGVHVAFINRSGEECVAAVDLREAYDGRYAKGLEDSAYTRIEAVAGGAVIMDSVIECRLEPYGCAFIRCFE